MGIFNTRPRFADIQIKQLSGDTITLSGTTNISGTFKYIPGATTGYVLKAIDSSGTVGWGSVSSLSADTNTFVTGGTLNATNQLVLDWNNGSSATPIDLSNLNGPWTAGTSGTGSIRVTNGGTTDATDNYAVAAGFNNTASGRYSFIAGGNGNLTTGNYSHAEGNSTTASGSYTHAEGVSTTAGPGPGAHSEGGSTIASGAYSHAEGENTIALGGSSHAGGDNSISLGDVSFVHSSSSFVTGNRSAILGGLNITGTTNNTTYVPTLTVRGDHILHSDTTLEVSDIPSNFEDTIKGSYTEFNWTGLTASVLSNSNISGYTSFLLGDLSTYPATEDHGFLSYYSSGYNRSGSSNTGPDFYRNKLVLKAALDSNGTVFSHADPDKKWWWETGTSSAMVFASGKLGIGLDIQGSLPPTSKLDLSGNTGFNLLRLRTPFTPTDTTDTDGEVGQIAWDDDYLYVKTNNGWGRMELDYVF